MKVKCKSRVRNGMECGMEYGMCLGCLLEDNYVTIPPFRGIPYYPLTIIISSAIFDCNAHNIERLCSIH